VLDVLDLLIKLYCQALTVDLTGNIRKNILETPRFEPGAARLWSAPLGYFLYLLNHKALFIPTSSVFLESSRCTNFQGPFSAGAGLRVSWKSIGQPRQARHFRARLRHRPQHRALPRKVRPENRPVLGYRHLRRHGGHRQRKDQDIGTRFRLRIPLIFNSSD